MDSKVLEKTSTATIDSSSGDVFDAPIDHAAEAKMTRKLDTHIIPCVMLLYLCSFLDKVNIGNARLYHLEEDLGLKGNQFQLATSLLYVTYVTCEIPSNLILKKMRPSRWIAFITLAWGMIATLMGLCQNFGGFVACRLLLGVFEAGLFPGLTIYLTMFYTKHELALRVGYLFVSAALAGACGGLLAYGIGHMDGVAGMHGWRWILIFEGIPTVILGIFVYFALADDPEHCYYLNAEEKALLIAKRNRQPGYTESGLHLHRKDVISALTDWKVWVFCLGHFGSDTMLYGYSTFLPTIVKSLGHWTTPQVQALTIPCYILGAIAYIIMAKLSDTQQKRALYSILACGISVIGYGVLVSDASSGVHYLGCFLVACGLYVVVGIPMSWVPINAPRYGKKVTASGLQLTIGNCGGILAPFLYTSDQGPRYVMGQATTLALVCWAASVFAFMWFWLGRINRNRDAGKEDHLFEGRSADEVAELGDRSPHFRYTI